MPGYQESIDVAAPLAEVWAVMSGVERWQEWTPTITSVTPLDGAGDQLGRRFRIKQPKLAPMVWTITEWEPERSFTWTAAMVGLTGRATHTLEPQPNGAIRVTLGVKQTGPFAWLAHLLFGGITARYVHTEAECLKATCERRAALAVA